MVDKFTRRVPDDFRKRMRTKRPLPKVTTTKTPKLDPFMEAEASAGQRRMTKSLERSLAPLTMVIDTHNTCEVPSKQVHEEGTIAAAELVGNANARISCIRKRKIIGNVNVTLLPIARDNDIWQ